ncbi:MAG TPA: SDR family oxidoreductase [Baekduia sp.]|nr:SDR family oxidoreductase [Baekduia sp.]
MPDAPVLITGAASGIGRATAQALRAAGLPVVTTDLRDGDHPCDLSDPSAVDVLAAALPERLGGVAHVAGLPGTHPPQRVVAVNLLAPRRLTAALLPRVAPGGAVVCVASVAQFRSTVGAERVQELLAATDEEVLAWLAQAGLDGVQAYDFSKQALVALARRQAREAMAAGVRVLSVSPGPVETPILGDFRQSMGEDRMDAAAAVVGRHGRPEEVAAVIAFLLSEQARWVNAVDLLVDGGLLGTR